MRLESRIDVNCRNSKIVNHTEHLALCQCFRIGATRITRPTRQIDKDKLPPPLANLCVGLGQDATKELQVRALKSGGFFIPDSADQTQLLTERRELGEIDHGIDRVAAPCQVGLFESLQPRQFGDPHMRKLTLFLPPLAGLRTRLRHVQWARSRSFEILDAQLHGRFDEAYGYVTAHDRAAKTLETYKTDESIAVVFAAKTSFSVKSSQANGDRAKVILAVTHPDYSGMLEQVVGAAFAFALGGQPTAETQKAIADKLAKSSAPLKTDDLSLALQQFAEGWKVVTGWAAESKIANAKKLAEQKQFEAAKIKYQEALASGADVAALKDSIDALDPRIAAKKEQEKYLANVVVGNVEVHLNSGRLLDEAAVYGEVKNQGDKTLNEVEITIYCLDESGNRSSKRPTDQSS